LQFGSLYIWNKVVGDEMGGWKIAITYTINVLKGEIG
jgi:hypothetical protein